MSGSRAPFLAVPFLAVALASLAAACGGTSDRPRSIGVNWSVTNQGRGQATCEEIAGYTIDILQVDNSVVSFGYLGCQAGVVSSQTASLRKGVYTGRLQLLDPSGTVVVEEPVATFDLTGPDELVLTHSFVVNVLGRRFISVSWSVADTATGQLATCAEIAAYSVQIVQTDDTVVSFENQAGACREGVMYSTTPELQTGVYTGSLQLVSPNGNVLQQEAGSFDVTPGGELALSRTFAVADVCSHNRYFSVAWSADHGNINQPLGCREIAGYGVRVIAAPPLGTFDLSSACDESFAPSSFAVSSDAVAPGSYNTTVSLLDASGKTVSLTPSLVVTVGDCSPGVVGGDAGVAFLVP
jgi:hypothetical protein